MKKVIFWAVFFLLPSFLAFKSFSSDTLAKHDSPTPTPTPTPAQVTICHATNSEGNSFQQITVDEDAVDGQGNGDHNRDNHQGGKDIIPPGSWDADGRNWDSAGQAIWRNGCVVPTATPTVVPTPTPTPTPTFMPTATPTMTSTPVATATPSGEPTSEPTPEPTVTPLSCPEGKHVDASGKNCVEYQFGGPSTTGGATAGGQVLGASTLAATGTFAENLYLAIMALGGLLTLKGIQIAFKKAR